MSKVTVGKDISSRIKAAFFYDASLPSQVTTPFIARPEKLKQSQKTIIGEASRLSENSESLRGAKRQSNFLKFSLPFGERKGCSVNGYIDRKSSGLFDDESNII